MCPKAKRLRAHHSEALSPEKPKLFQVNIPLFVEGQPRQRLLWCAPQISISEITDP